MRAELNEQAQKDGIRKFLTSHRYPSMSDAKNALIALIGVGVLKFPTVNDLYRHLGLEEVSYGDDWGWPNLYYDLLSNKYGAAARYNQSTKKTNFVLQLPTPERIVTVTPTSNQ